MAKIKKLAVLTSGGDAPGMNVAIRAVVRTAIYNGLEVVGVKEGYSGMINNDFIPMASKNVSDIISKGGTILKTARCEEFRTKEGRQIAYDNAKAQGIDALVVIGGDGSFQGAKLFSEEFDIPTVGIPGTIDNDLFGTDSTIGYDTALNTVIEAIDKIRDTATSHKRMFFVEVMGRDAGFLALRSGIGSGAEAILIPEVHTPYEKLKTYLNDKTKGHKSSSIVIVAEGAEGMKEGGVFKLAERVKADYPELDIRVSVLGHMQRGGAPSAFDRVLASQLGRAAVEALLDAQQSIMVGIQNNKVTHVPFNQAIKNKKSVNLDLLALSEILSI
jgi:6-phosphofructokinase 1